MLSILTKTELHERVETAIASVDRLNELVKVVEQYNEATDLRTLVVEADRIIIPFDWYDFEPPYTIPNISYSEDNLLALVFMKLGNHQKAFEFVKKGSTLYQHLLTATHLQFGYEISAEMLNLAEETSPHNVAVLKYYGNFARTYQTESLKDAFSTAISQAENDELRIFSLKHYVSFLLDVGSLQEAKKLIDHYSTLAISDDAKFALDLQLTAILKQQLQVPYQIDTLNRILDLQLMGINTFESKGLKIQAGLLQMEAAEIANFKQDFITAKELINKAIQYFREEDIPEFLGEAGLKKAILLYTWSKNGSPQYYKAAINAFQDVLKVFKRDTHPQEFADVHHNLALIYSEIHVGAEEKPMWTAFCASSFKEVLAFYTRENYPYENAMASHNYATALMDFPPAKIHDNLEKASELFKSALETRTADAYPFERALTLLNQLQLAWLTHNENSRDELVKYEEMKAKAEEIKTLVTEADLIAKADEHLRELEKVKTLI